MKITILKEKFKEGINVVEKITSKILSLPILQNIFIQVEKNFIKLTTTNLESVIIWQDLVKVEKEGSICIPMRVISNFLNFLPEKPISLELKNLILNIECESYKTKIKGVNPEDFPIIPEVKENEFILVDCNSFCQSLSQIINIPTQSLSRPEISGIYFSFQENLIKMVATDTFRLAEKKFSLKNGFQKEVSFILPHLAAREIVNIFGEREGELKIYFSPSQVLLDFTAQSPSHSQIKFISRLIEGEYPNYQQIIPQKYETSALLQKEEFLNQIKMASFFSSKRNEIGLKINPKEGEIEISSQNPDLGEYQSPLKGEIEGKPLSISFNHRFLVEGIAKIKSQKLIFGLTNEESAAVLKPADADDYLYIIMPIKAT